MHPTLSQALAGVERPSGALDPDAKDERRFALLFAYEGRAWGAHADTLIERLHDLAAAIDEGRARERVTPKGTRSLWDGRVDHLYVYEVGGISSPPPTRAEVPGTAPALVDTRGLR